MILAPLSVSLPLQPLQLQLQPAQLAEPGQQLLQKKIAELCLSNLPDPILAQFSPVWQRCKAWCFKQRALKQELQRINVSGFDLSPQWEVNCTTLLLALKSPEYLSLASVLREIVKKLNYGQMNALFKQLALDLLKQEPSNSVLLENCLKLFTLDELERFLREMIPNFMEVGALATKMERQLAESADDPALMAQFKQQKPYLTRLINHIIETLLSAFSFFKAGSRTEGSFHASQLLAVYRDLFITLPINVFIAMRLCFHGTVGALAATTVFLTTLFTSSIFYVKKIKTRPEEVSYCKNIVEEAHRGKIESLVGRKREMDTLLAQLKKGAAGIRERPLLVGDTGVGKTLLLRALGLKIARGNDPWLANKSLHVANIPYLAQDNFGVCDRVKILMDEVENYSEEMIIGLDELAAAFKGSGNLADKLIALLDELPYVIGVMTEADYDKYIKPREEFRSRFVRIDIKSTEEVETVQVLSHVLLEKNVYLSEELLKKIYQLSKEKLPQCAQPLTAKQVLYDTLDQYQRAHLLDLELEKKWLALKSRYFSYQCSQYKMAVQIAKVEGVSAEKMAEIKKRFLFSNYYLARQLDQDVQGVLRDMQEIYAQHHEEVLGVVEGLVAKRVRVDQ